jgi:hypothetical protein
MGKIPMQEKNAQRGQKNNPINCSGYKPEKKSQSWLCSRNDLNKKTPA